MIVTAIASFNHDGKSYSFGDTPNFTRATAHALHAKGLVSLTGLPATNPHQAGGRASRSSASPPAQVSPQRTSSSSELGEGLSKKDRRRIKKFLEQS